MSSLREAAERDRITVKIRNMNRSASRDSPPLGSSHSGSRGTKRGPTMGRYDGGGGGGGGSSDERMTPDRLRRRVRSPSPRARYVSPHRDEYSSRMSREVPMDRGGGGHSYKVLCVSALHHKASDDFIKETLYREFKRFGDFSIRIAHDVDERVAYVCFRTSEDARDAKHAKPRVMLYDKPAVVEPVIETSRPPHSSSSGGGGDYNKYKARSRTPDYDRVYYAPPPSSDRRRGPPPVGVDPYYGSVGGMGGGGGHHGLPPPSVAAMHANPRDFRPVMHHGGGGGLGGGGMGGHHHADMYAAPRGPPMHHGGGGGGGGPPLPPPHHHHMAAHHGAGGGGGGHHHLGVGGGGGGHLGGGGAMPPSLAPHHYVARNNPNSGGAGGGGMMARSNAVPHENKKDKFPNYLHHVQPEDDPMATRTLFAGNLEINISEEELRRIFGKYGVCEDIDIKRPPPGTGNAFAFVRFQNLDMAHRAKVELSGQYIGKFQCKIGYGKSSPSTKIWVGGLGAWTSITQLEREFDRYGSIKKVEYQKGDTFAHITYETIEASTAAVKEMRGYELGGPDRRLRIDYVDNNPAPSSGGGGGGVGGVMKPRLGPPGYEAEIGGGVGGGEYGRPGGEYGGGGDYGGPDGGYDRYGGRGGGGYRGAVRGGPPSVSAVGGGGYRGGGPPPPLGSYGAGRPGYGGGDGRPGGPGEEEWRRPPADLEYEPNHRAQSAARRSGSREPGVDRSRSRSHHRRSPGAGGNGTGGAPAGGADSDSDSSFRRAGGNAGGAPGAGGSASGASASGGQMSAARTLPDVARKCTKLWQGALILKSSLFPAKFHMTDGDADIVDGLMRDEDGKHHLRITQRLRLDQPKLEDVQKRIQSSAAHAIFLGLAGSTSAAHLADDASVQTRPLRNLVSYLKQKEAAGVISLLNKETEATGVLYAFPPCDFSAELLRKTCAGVTDEALKEDHLVIVVVRGGTA